MKYKLSELIGNRVKEKKVKKPIKLSTGDISDSDMISALGFNACKAEYDVIEVDVDVKKIEKLLDENDKEIIKGNNNDIAQAIAQALPKILKVTPSPIR